MSNKKIKSCFRFLLGDCLGDEMLFKIFFRDISPRRWFGNTPYFGKDLLNDFLSLSKPQNPPANSWTYVWEMHPKGAWVIFQKIPPYGTSWGIYIYIGQWHVAQIFLRNHVWDRKKWGMICDCGTISSNNFPYLLLKRISLAVSWLHPNNFGVIPQKICLGNICWNIRSAGGKLRPKMVSINLSVVLTKKNCRQYILEMPPGLVEK